MQSWIVDHYWMIKTANWIYFWAHMPLIVVGAVWLYIRHRDAYHLTRNAFLASGAIGVAIYALYPVAPPRLLPEYGFVDTGLLLGQSVYGSFGAGVSAQLAAMPSIHVAWAVLVGAAGWTIGRGRWRWIGPAHAVLTVFVVTDTANHWWLDSIVGGALLIPAFLGARALHDRNRSGRLPEPALVDAAA